MTSYLIIFYVLDDEEKPKISVKLIGNRQNGFFPKKISSMNPKRFKIHRDKPNENKTSKQNDRIFKV